jgi:diadenosine tetraphosphate (Ap4A) HIT family hydrolase
MSDCEICARGSDGRGHPGSVGGNVYEDQHWHAHHAPVTMASLGQLFLVSRRHFLDFSEMTPDEATSYGRVLRALYAALKQVVDAERVCLRVTLEGVPHFHTWLFTRRRGEAERGIAFMAAERSCSEAAALAVVGRLRDVLASRTLNQDGRT